MDNKKLGILIIAAVLILGIIYSIFYYKVRQDLVSSATFDEQGRCIHQEGLQCPYQQLEKLNPYNYLIMIGLSVILLFGVYLAFFEKSEKEKKELIKVIKDTGKEKIKEEKFSALLSVLNENERKTVNAVKEQDGISQTTLRIRLGFSKSKLSALLSDLEKRNLITKVGKGKVNYIYLK